MSKVFKKIGKVLKGAVKFIKKKWRTIVLVAATVFTAGLATVGFAGMSGAYAGFVAGGSNAFMAALQTAGSVMWAGVTATAGSLGIGSGASGAAAAAGNVTGVGLFGGHAAAALGSKSAAAGITEQAAAKGALSPLLAGSSAPLATAASTTVPTAGELSPLLAKAATPAVVSPAAAPIAEAVAAPVAKKGIMDTLGGAALVQGGMGALSGYMQGRAIEDQQPIAQWGINFDGSMPSYVVPGIINPATGQPITPEEAYAINTGSVAPPSAPGVPA